MANKMNSCRKYAVAAAVRRGDRRKIRYAIIPALIGVFFFAVVAYGDRTATSFQKEAYRLFQFDSESGMFDPLINANRLKAYWHQWKLARKINYVLNPDKAHGRECGTYRYLHAKWLMKTPCLPDFTFFLVRPGKKPCDYDEACSPPGSAEATTCAHTQYIYDFPVIIDPTGNPYHRYTMDRAFFNALIQSRSMSIETEIQAAQLARLYIFLVTTGSRNTIAHIVELEVRSEGKRFDIRARLSVPTESKVNTKRFCIAADGTVSTCLAPEG